MKEPSLAPDRRQPSQIDIDRIASEYNNGACTQRELARRHGVCVGTIRNWLKRHRLRHPEVAGPWVEVLATGPARPGCYRVELPNGRALVLADNWQPERVRELLEAICGV